MSQMVFVVLLGLILNQARGKFVKYLKDNNIGRKDSYYGGYTIWVSGFGQSMTRKENYARAFVKVLNENGLKSICNE